MSAEIVALRRKDGTAEFDCVQCGAHVVSFDFHGREPVCALCTVWGEDWKQIQAWLDRNIPGPVLLNVEKP